MPHASEPLAFARENKERLADLALELLSVDTQNPPGETRGLVDSLEDSFLEWGLEVERYAVDSAKPNLIATLPGETDRTLCFNGHVDTVPFDREAWAYDPLGERVEVSKNGDTEIRLYGRGATDMKGPLASMLLAARSFGETETTPPVTLSFAIVSDEETGGAGLKTLLESGRLDADACVIGETTCERGNHSVAVADRGSIWLSLSATGEAAHGSRPMLGENAIDRLWTAIERIRDRLPARTFDLDPAIEPIVEESVDYYGPAMGREAARELFTRPTVNLGTIEGGEAVNSVPQAARARLDIRLTAGVATPRILADVRKCIDDVEGVTIDDASWSVGTAEPIDAPLVEAIAALAGDVTGEHSYRRSATGGGDAKKLRNAGISTVEFALGTDTAHAIDEYTTLEALQANAEIYARLPDAFARTIDA
ncbi:Acetylornithine deacetylase/Succinyl-diaminopimelate desuccinylase or related deacylase [Halalkaliarchaeum sp. AArc-CO]|uniref:M20 family metallopeptidase n=1 Tax=Halalkaliarchaeum sp. AArc-CO TaxID=2866381 RepID=UPI00217E552A|nr:M20 family metallopeptidase [Halalkaliarchaeum sp. AArc-CO]UWG49557.1 Acetylornithine deacetylase/Succinyl-diaminopimelate desuccinylase or related deacylase [Halalkaliarchaeum sp. AArc-CO]